MTEENTLIEMPEIKLPARTEVKAKFKEGFGSVYTKIEKEIAETPVDMTTQKGRDAIRSLAYKIAQTRTGLDDLGKTSTAGLTDVVKAVNEERAEMNETLKKMQADVRAPLTAWEEKEKRREEGVKADFFFLRNIAAQSHNGVQYLDMDADQLDALAGDIDAKTPCDVDVFLDASENFNVLAVEVHATIEGRAVRLRAEERDRQELAALRARQEREETERVEREAAFAEKTRKEFEAKEMAAEAARIAQRDAQERIDAETKRAADAERDAEAAKEAKVKADAEAERYREQVKADKIEAEEKAANEKLAAEKLAEERIAESNKLAAEEGARQRRQADEDAAQAKRQAETDKQAAIKADRHKRDTAERAETAAAEARAADLEHRKKINNAAMSAIMKVSEVTEIEAKTIVKAIANAKIPNVKIEY